MNVIGSNNQEGLPSWMDLFFWDVTLNTLDLEKNRVFIIERLLNVGDEKTLLWIFKNYPMNLIKESVLKSRGLSLKTARCWQNYFNLKEEEMRCFGIFSTGIKGPF